MAAIENDVLIKYKDTSGNTNVIYPVTRSCNVYGLDKTIRDQSVTTSGNGSAYTATVDGITALSAGISFVMTPHVVSTSTNPTLNVNKLGAKQIRRRASSSTDATSVGASADWLAAGKPIRVFYDGAFWIADLPRPRASELLGITKIQNGGTGASTAEIARVNLGIETVDGSVTSNNAGYAEVCEWLDGNPTSEDRVGYFVSVRPSDRGGALIGKGIFSDDVKDIKGVTVSAPAFAGNCSDDKFDSNGELLLKYSYVAVTGNVSVIDNGTCDVFSRCMPAPDGTAAPVSSDYGYLVLDRVDDTHVLISFDPSITSQYKLKSYVDRKTRTATATLSLSAWSNNSQTVEVGGVTSNNTVVVTPAPRSFSEYAKSAVYCSAQSTGRLTFNCTDTPSSSLTVNILIHT